MGLTTKQRKTLRKFRRAAKDERRSWKDRFRFRNLADTYFAWCHRNNEPVEECDDE